MAVPQSLYNYSANTSTSTVSQAHRSLRDSRYSPHPSLPAGTPVPAASGNNVIDHPLNRTRGAEVGLGAWAFMFAEIVSYSQSRVDSVADLEKR
jgi:hypothetical protein